MANVFHPFSLTAKRDQPELSLFPIPPLSPLPFYVLSLLSTVPACSASQPAVLKNICFIINHGNTVAVQCTNRPLPPIKFKSMVQPQAPCRYFPKCKKRSAWFDPIMHPEGDWQRWTNTIAALPPSTVQHRLDLIFNFLLHLVYGL